MMRMRFQMIGLGMICTGFFLPSQALRASNYFVSKNHPAGCSDSYDGSSEEPWCTIQKAADTLQAGEGVTVTSGSYDERVYVNHGGESGAPIVFQAESGVVMQGFRVIDADYITISGFEVADAPCHWADGFGIRIEDSSHCLIENNYINNCNRGGIIIASSSDLDDPTINNCIIRNNLVERCARGAGIEVVGRSHIVEYNEVWGMIQFHPNCYASPPSSSPNGEDSDGFRFFGSGHVFRNNRIHDIDCSDPWVVDSHADCFQTWGPAYDIVFERNYCRNGLADINTNNGVTQSFMTEEIHSPMEGLVIRNNVLEATHMQLKSCDGCVVVHNVFSAPVVPQSQGEYAAAPTMIIMNNSPDSTVKNNIFRDTSLERAWYLHLETSSGTEVSHNVFYRPDGQMPRGSPHPHDIWTDPLFVDDSGWDFRLQQDSVCIDAGASLTSVTEDFEGTPRPQGSSWDIGAFEYTVDSPCLDMDGDSFGAAGLEHCAFSEFDCDDDDFHVNPGADERCNHRDDDCDSLTDEQWPSLGSSCSAGLGACRRQGVVVCSASGDTVMCSATPGAAGTELCGDGLDNDCDSFTDDGDSDCSAGEQGDSPAVTGGGCSCASSSGSAEGFLATVVLLIMVVFGFCSGALGRRIFWEKGHRGRQNASAKGNENARAKSSMNASAKGNEYGSEK